MLKKHLFLQRAIRRLTSNVTVVFVDAFDVLFQRPLEEFIQAYQRLAQRHLEVHGVWPMIYGGDLNCWPFPHNARLRVPKGVNRTWFHRIPPDAALSGAYHGAWRYPSASGEIEGSEVCREWLARHSNAAEAPRKNSEAPTKQRLFPFVCSGTFMGRVGTLRRVLREMFQLYKRTSEYHDQALIPLVLLRFPDLGFVDKDAQLFLGLHGHDEFWDLERPLCRGSYFQEQDADGFRRLLAPSLRFGPRPMLLHFNGNGKRHMWRCVEEFRRHGLLGGEGEDTADCEFLDVDRDRWKRMGKQRKKWCLQFAGRFMRSLYFGKIECRPPFWPIQSAVKGPKGLMVLTCWGATVLAGHLQPLGDYAHFDIFKQPSLAAHRASIVTWARYLNRCHVWKAF